MVDQKELDTQTASKKLTLAEAWAKQRDTVNPYTPAPNWKPKDLPYKDRQRIKPPMYLIAVSERLREYQALYGRSALSALKILETGVTAGLGPVVEGRLWAWKGVMSDRKTTLKERAGAEADIGG